MLDRHVMHLLITLLVLDAKQRALAGFNTALVLHKKEGVQCGFASTYA